MAFTFLSSHHAPMIPPALLPGAMVHSSEFPTEGRDRDLEAHLELAQHRELRAIRDENIKLKRLLRENGIAWSPLAATYLQKHSDKPKKLRTRADSRINEQKDLSLPVEVILCILRYAMTSDHPIVDPLSAMTPDHLTNDEKRRNRKCQIALQATATCKGLREEALKYFWSLNRFVLTTPEAVKKLGLELPTDYRALIKEVNFRIVAHYFDDQNHRNKSVSEVLYHPEVRCRKYPVVNRPRNPMSLPQGLRSISWTLLEDFLAALCGLPGDKPAAGSGRAFRQSTPRPRLLPALGTLSLDFVNFFDYALDSPGRDLHLIAAHDLRGSLDEVQVTGMPNDPMGMDASVELAALLKRDGLYLECLPRYLRQSKGLKALSGRKWCSRVMTMKDTSNLAPRHGGLAQKPREGCLGLPTTPKETGYPGPEDDDKYLWKRVPVSRDSTERCWEKFHRQRGYPMQGPFTPFGDDSEILDGENEDFFYCCAGCGERHAYRDLWFEFEMMDEEDDDL